VLGHVIVPVEDRDFTAFLHHVVLLSQPVARVEHSETDHFHHRKI